MEDSKLIAVHNQTLEGVRSNKKQSKILLVLFAFCFIGVLVFAGYIYKTSLGLVYVVETNGQYLPTRLERRQHLIVNTIKDFTTQSNYLVNSINRMTVQSNIAKARILISPKDLAFIFNTYKKNKYYARAKEQGFEYKTELVRFENIDITKKPYTVSFISKTSVWDGIRLKEEFYVRGEGEITEQPPIYEISTHGFYFSNYKQTYSYEEFAE